MAASKAAPARRRRRPATKSTHPLANRIPDAWYGDDYIGRFIGGIEDIEIIRAARRMKHNVLIEGPTGSAKTSLIYAAAAKDRLPVVNVPCNGAVEPSQLFGRWVPKEDGTYHFQPGEFTLAAMHGGYIYLDEVNFMPPRIGAVMHGAMDKRRTVTLLDAMGALDWDGNLHPDCIIIAAYNADYVGTRPLNEAFKNRFAVKMNFSYDRVVEDSLLASPALLDFAWQLRGQHRSGELHTPISTNMLLEFEQFCAEPGLGFGFAMENFLAAFDDDERKVVQQVMENWSDRLSTDLDGLTYADGDDASYTEDDDTDDEDADDDEEVIEF